MDGWARADLLLLALAQVVGVADDAALAAAERDVHDRPVSPPEQRAEGVRRLVGLTSLESGAWISS